MIPFGVNVARQEGVFEVATFEGSATFAPPTKSRRGRRADAIVLSVQHSGSVRYYANRITLRYDWLKEGALDAALRDLAAKGRRAYLVVDDWEEKEFRARFSPANRAGRGLGRRSRACPAARKCAFSSCRTEVLLPPNEKGARWFFSSTAPSRLR